MTRCVVTSQHLLVESDENGKKHQFSSFMDRGQTRDLPNANDTR
jgi:hypothetical protein